MRVRAKVDRNHAEIIETLRKCGWYVYDSSRLGRGFPDLVAAKGERLELIEVKDGSKPLSARRLTPDEREANNLTMRTVRVRVFGKPNNGQSARVWRGR